MTSLTPLFIGAAVALVVSVYAAWINFDRDRAFYPTVLSVTASYYVLFSVFTGSARTMIGEISIMVVFLLAAALGFRRNLWLVVVAFTAHAILDAFHGSLVSVGRLGCVVHALYRDRKCP